MLVLARKFLFFIGFFIFCPLSHADWDAASSARLYRFAPPVAIAERYIVTLKPGAGNAQSAAEGVMGGHGGRVHQHFKHGLRAFVATLSDAALERVRQHPQVLAVEPDRRIDMYQVGVIERDASWGLDRIDQVDRPLDGQYRFRYSGAGVTAYVVDSGIRPDHTEFSGRLLAGFSAIQDGGDSNDCVGHGTHVAGTLGGKVWGVAKGVWLVPVRVLDCNGSGTISGVISGLEWIASQKARPAVANVSVGTVKSAAVNAAVANLVKLGITVVVAAGNGAKDACTSSPGNEPTAITVGATNRDDAVADYSNYGSCVKVFAPGSGISSAWNTTATATNTLSGTSMASPHVAGVVALALQARPSATPAEVAQFLLDNASTNKLTQVPQASPNKLVFALSAGAPGLLPMQTAAVKSITFSTSPPGRPGELAMARIRVAVRDVRSGAALANAQVSATMAPGGTASCTTDSSGACSIAAAYDAGFSFTVDAVSGTNLEYDASQNAAAQVRVPSAPFRATAIPMAPQR